MTRIIEFPDYTYLHCYSCGKDYPLTKEEANQDKVKCPECNK